MLFLNALKLHLIPCLPYQNRKKLKKLIILNLKKYERTVKVIQIDWIIKKFGQLTLRFELLLKFL